MPATPDVRVNNCVIRFESTGDPGRVALLHVCGAHADKCAFYGRATRGRTSSGPATTISVGSGKCCTTRWNPAAQPA